MKINTEEQLRELYGWPRGRASIKVLTQLEEHCTNFVSKSPFLVMSTVDKRGSMDASPRGGDPGFVKVINETTIVIPDSKGNNRVDSLVNIVETGAVGLLFLLPGVDETLRINGRAHISTDAQYLEEFLALKNPTMGRMLKDQLGGDGPIETVEEMKRRYTPDL